MIYFDIKVLLASVLFTTVISEKLLVILLDGFRWDYVEKFNLQNFKRLYDIGARADYLKSNFPTLSYPNYYSLMTGLNTEMHGMTGNFMYDVNTRETFLIGGNPEIYNAHWWDGGEPLWIGAKRQNTSSYMFYWPGCDVTIRNMTPTFCVPYTHVPTSSEVSAALDQSLKLLSNGTTNFAAVYSEEPDYTGHKNGPDSREMANTLVELDSQIGNVLDQARQLKTINVIIMSDHGMTNVDPSRIINITDVLLSSPDLYVTVMEAGALASIYVANSSVEEKVMSLLSNFHANLTCYKKTDIPDRWFYKHGKYVSDITCVADNGWYIQQPLHLKFPEKNGTLFHGYHGYDNNQIDMRAIFYAYGPDFKSGSRVEYLEAVDIYNMMCAILTISPQANNGSLTRISSLTLKSLPNRAPDCTMNFIALIAFTISINFLTFSF